MKASQKKITYCYLLALILFNLCIRIVPVPPRGGDSWAMAYKAEIMSEEGFLVWYLHPLSFLGWYPFSYPAGFPMSISAISQVTGLHIIPTIYGFSIFVTILGCLSVFLLCRKLNKNLLFPLVTIFFISSYYYYTKLTWNNGSARALFIVLWPLAPVLYMKIIDEKQNRYRIALLALALTFALASIHRMFVFFGAMVLLPFFIILLSNKINYYPRKLESINVPNPIMTLLVPLALLFQLFFNFIPLSDHSKSFIGTSTSFSTLLNLGIDYQLLNNISVILVPLGVIYLLQKKYLSVGETWLLMVSTIGIIFIRDISYFLNFISPIAAILAAYGLFFASSNASNLLVKLSAFSVTVLSSLMVTVYFWSIDSNILFLLSLFAFIFLSRILFNMMKYTNSEFGKQLVAALIVVSMCLVVHNTVYLVAKKGAWEFEYQSFSHGNAFWIRENFGDGNWISDSGRLKTEAGTLSLSETRNIEADVKLLQTTGLLIGDKLDSEAEFTIELVWQGSRTAYVYNLDRRYDPPYVKHSILTLHDEQLASHYGLKYVVTEHIQTSGEEVISDHSLEHMGSEQNELIYFVEAERYIIYERDAPENIPNSWTSFIAYYY